MRFISSKAIGREADTFVETNDEHFTQEMLIICF